MNSASFGPRATDLPPSRAPGVMALAFRMLLVLLLVFDQVSAPLHAHHHDGGVDGSMAALAHAAGEGDETHAEPIPDAESHHGVMALRGEVRAVAAQPEHDGADDALRFAIALAAASYHENAAAIPWPWAPDTAFAVHKDLPPEGRAPPLHA